MLREYRLQTWLWWTTIGACGLSFLLGLGPRSAHATASEPARVSVRAASTAGSPSQAAPPVPRVRAQAAASTPAAVESPEVRAATKPVSRRLRRLATSEVSAEMLVIAQRLIRKHHQDRPGTEIPFEVGGESFVARVERHYHPEGGPVKPWGYHPGISLFEAP